MRLYIYNERRFSELWMGFLQFALGLQTIPFSLPIFQDSVSLSLLTFMSSLSRSETEYDGLIRYPNNISQKGDRSESSDSNRSLLYLYPDNRKKRKQTHDVSKIPLLPEHDSPVVSPSPCEQRKYIFKEEPDRNTVPSERLLHDRCTDDVVQIVDEVESEDNIRSSAINKYDLKGKILTFSTNTNESSESEEIVTANKFAGKEPIKARSARRADDLDWIDGASDQSPHRDGKNDAHADTSSSSIAADCAQVRRDAPCLEKILKKQEDKIVESHKCIQTPRKRSFQSASTPSPKSKRKLSESAGQQEDSSCPEEDMSAEMVRGRWHKMIFKCERLYPDLFVGPSAELEDHETITVKKGQTAYAGLPVHPNNCFDLNMIYENKYKSRTLFNIPGASSFSLARSAIGQFMRWGVVAGALKKKDGWKKNSLFNLMLNVSLVKCFVNYYIIVGSPATVTSKCATLLTVSQAARCSLGGDAEATKHIDHCIAYLRSTFNASKAKAREKARLNQCAEKRVMSTAVITEDDIKKGIRLSRQILDDVTNSFLKDVGKYGKQKALSELRENGPLIDKWCLNFLSLIALTGGGQRPQAYATLQCPTSTQIKSWFVGDNSISETIELNTTREKTARALDIPCVLFPSFLKVYIRFHVTVVRPFLYEDKTKSGDRSGVSKCLLLHSRTGMELSSRNISESIKTFMVNLDGRFRTVTCMTLRASYATSMLHSFRSGRLGDGLSEEKFLELVAKQMNSSVEQLRNTYAACYSTDFHETMKLVAQHMHMILHEYDEDDVLPAPN